MHKLGRNYSPVELAGSNIDIDSKSASDSLGYAMDILSFKEQVPCLPNRRLGRIHICHYGLAVTLAETIVLSRTQLKRFSVRLVRLYIYCTSAQCHIDIVIIIVRGNIEPGAMDFHINIGCPDDERMFLAGSHVENRFSGQIHTPGIGESPDKGEYSQH